MYRITIAVAIYYQQWFLYTGVLVKCMTRNWLFHSCLSRSERPEPRCTCAEVSIYHSRSTVIRSFEKGLADRGGWREKILPVPEIAASFLHPFSYAPLGEGGHISGERFSASLGFVSRQQGPPEPVRGVLQVPVFRNKNLGFVYPNFLKGCL